MYCDLRGILYRSRISGFTLEYTEELFRATFCDGDEEPQWNLARDCAWPPVPEQNPVENLIPPMRLSQVELPCTPTTNFAKDVEDEMLKYESSVYSEKTKAEDSSVTGGMPKSDISSTLADHIVCNLSEQSFPLCE